MSGLWARYEKAHDSISRTGDEKGSTTAGKTEALKKTGPPSNSKIQPSRRERGPKKSGQDCSVHYPVPKVLAVPLNRGVGLW